MQPISISITIQPRHIPRLICSDYSDKGLEGGYDVVVAQAVAKLLGVQEFLFRPERIHELQRRLWEQDHSNSESLALRLAD